VEISFCPNKKSSIHFCSSSLQIEEDRRNFGLTSLPRRWIATFMPLHNNPCYYYLHNTTSINEKKPSIKYGILDEPDKTQSLFTHSTATNDLIINGWTSPPQKQAFYTSLNTIFQVCPFSFLFFSFLFCFVCFSLLNAESLRFFFFGLFGAGSFSLSFIPQRNHPLRPALVSLRPQHCLAPLKRYERKKKKDEGTDSVL
jgi:hypothetical protein